jgi:hypothetical protein
MGPPGFSARVVAQRIESRAGRAEGMDKFEYKEEDEDDTTECNAIKV